MAVTNPKKKSENRYLIAGFFSDDWVKVIWVTEERRGEEKERGRKKKHVLWVNDLYCFCFF